MTYEDHNAAAARPPGAEELIIASGGRLTVASGGVVATADGVGAVAHSSVTAEECGCGAVHHTQLTLSGSPVLMLVEAVTVGWGSLKLYDMPAGAIQFLGAVANLTVERFGTEISATFDGDFGIGTVAADNDASLATTEQNIIPTTATPQAVAGATTAKGQSTAAESIVVKGTTTAVDVYLNLLVDIADISDADGLTVNGTIDLFWINLGDY